jgi:superfamily II DNA helicase RecQ
VELSRRKKKARGTAVGGGSFRVAGDLAPGRTDWFENVAAVKVGVGAAKDDGLRERLREWRRGKAQEQGVPAFVVMHDTTLDGVCRVRPRSPGELRGVAGIGEKKLERYGAEILEVLRKFMEEGARAN